MAPESIWAAQPWHRGLLSRLSSVTDVTVRAARPDAVDGEQFARYLPHIPQPYTRDGLTRWMFGSQHLAITAKAFLSPGHDLSYQHVWLAESAGSVAGMVSGFSAADHDGARDGPLFRAAGLRAVRMIGAWLLGRRLFQFMDRVPPSDRFQRRTRG